MKIIVFGGDGFCGWPTALYLANIGHEVLIADNLSRRKIDEKISSNSLTTISSIQERVAVANKLVGNISFEFIDVANEPRRIVELLLKFKPDGIVQFAEQRSAPYSMIGDSERRYTMDNNISGTHNICSAVVEVDPSIHIVHLGTMGVYGYSDIFGPIPEGYLDIQIKQTGIETEILYPANPGSIYHLTKCLDQLTFQFYNKNWGLKITDLHQGIVWGIETEETAKSPVLVNRFDYDGIYGTVLNRFISQAANKRPLTIYGSGGQTRAFIHISDTAKCVNLALENSNFDNSRVRIFNQIAEVFSVRELAEIFHNEFGSEISYIDNPRKELAENKLSVVNTGLMSLGFDPITLSTDLIYDVQYLANKSASSFMEKNILTSPKW